MAVKFWEEKRKRVVRTTVTLVLFFILAIGVSILFEFFLRYFAEEGYTPSLPYMGFALLGFICLVSGLYYLSFAGAGGRIAAEAMGGKKVTPGDLNSPKEEMLLNIVQEMALASRLPIPEVYLIKANEINAFAAGLKPDKAVIGVTVGALNHLSREELEGVIAHEFGHIANGDMRIGMRLAALIMGFFLVFYIGIRILEGSFFFGGRGNGEKKGGSVALIALALLLAGALLWFAGSILRSCVNREREYLADASAVQYTRNPQGIANALKKIQILNDRVQDMPKSGTGYSHLYLDNRSFWCRLFATHPPLEKRIAILEGREN